MILNFWHFLAAIFGHYTSLMKKPRHLFLASIGNVLESFHITDEKFTKDVIMWSPDQALNLYLDGDKSKVVDLSNQALLDEKFPKFKNASKHIGRLQSGKDLLRNGHTLHQIYFFEIYHLGDIANVKTYHALTFDMHKVEFS